MHKWFGRIILILGFFNCWYGLQLVSEDAIFSLGFEGDDPLYNFTSFAVIRNYMFPAWMGLILLSFFGWEFHRVHTKWTCDGKLSLNKLWNNIKQEVVGDMIMFLPKSSRSRFEVPSTGRDNMPALARVKSQLHLPKFTMKEFNRAVLEGRRNW
ncbi:unnamed protein product, partial [Choristocarpus tenellus]